MPLWNDTITRMPRLKTIPRANEQVDTKAAAYPVCSIRGGLCDTLLTAVPMAIIGMQFIRGESNVVQDGIIIFANDHAENVFGEGRSLVGERFLAACQQVLLSGIWQRCIWLSVNGRSETIIEDAGAPEADRRFLTITPYGDGLILCRSLDWKQMGGAKDSVI